MFNGFFLFNHLLKMKGKETEKFIAKIERRFNSEPVSISEYERLMDEWVRIISDRCYVNGDTKQTYLKLNGLMLTVDWYKQQSIPSANTNLQNFLDSMIQYTNIELHSLEIHSDMGVKTQETKESQYGEIRWTDNKRSLIELISALDYTKCINNGNITIKSLVVLFEEIFNIKLDNYHSEINRMYSRNPKSNSNKQAYFLSKLTDGFNEKLKKTR